MFPDQVKFIVLINQALNLFVKKIIIYKYSHETFIRLYICKFYKEPQICWPVEKFYAFIDKPIDQINYKYFILG